MNIEKMVEIAQEQADELNRLEQKLDTLRRKVAAERDTEHREHLTHEMNQVQQGVISDRDVLYGMLKMMDAATGKYWCRDCGKIACKSK